MGCNGGHWYIFMSLLRLLVVSDLYLCRLGRLCQYSDEAAVSTAGLFGIVIFRHNCLWMFNYSCKYENHICKRRGRLVVCFEIQGLFEFTYDEKIEKRHRVLLFLAFCKLYGNTRASVTK